jgi:hypothetical protein
MHIFYLFASSIYVTLKLVNWYFYMHQMRNTPFLIDFTTSYVDCVERLVTIALVNATNIYCIPDLYTLMECHAKNTNYSEFFFAWAFIASSRKQRMTSAHTRTLTYAGVTPIHGVTSYFSLQCTLFQWIIRRSHVKNGMRITYIGGGQILCKWHMWRDV